MKIALVQLGCAKNLVDAEHMLGFLRSAGFNIVADQRRAEAIIVNTCSFIHSAKQESIDQILRLAKMKKNGRLKRLVVTGCLVQEFGPELAKALPEVDAFIGLGKLPLLLAGLLAKERDPVVRYNSVPDYLTGAEEPRWSLTPSYTAYLKICDGCDNHCSYCLIPGIRGRFRSRPLSDVVSEARQMAAAGVKEINIIGQDITQYGKDIPGAANLAGLLRELVKIPGPRWLRLMYTHPAHLDSEVIDIIAREKKICKYIDLPLQHINDQILKKMNRKVNRAQIEDLITEIRRRVPGVVLRTTFIVGFPGETEKRFSELYDFVQRTRFDRLGVFSYSREENTAAAVWAGQVAEKVKEHRRGVLMRLQQKIARENNRKYLGKDLEVLIEHNTRKGFWTGRSQGDAPEVDNQMLVKAAGKIKPGDFVRARVNRALAYDLIGEKI